MSTSPRDTRSMTNIADIIRSQKLLSTLQYVHGVVSAQNIGNESVPKIRINKKINFLCFNTAISISVISNNDSFAV